MDCAALLPARPMLSAVNLTMQSGCEDQRVLDVVRNEVDLAPPVGRENHPKLID
jgi:hypothetical protein